MKKLLIAAALVLSCGSAYAQSSNERCGDLWTQMQADYNRMVLGTSLPGWEELEEAGFNLNAKLLLMTVAMDNLMGPKSEIATRFVTTRQAYEALACEW